MIISNFEELHSENDSAGAARRGDRDYAAGRALRRMEALNVRKMETDENSSGALVAGEIGGGSHRLQSSGSVRGPLVEISTSKSRDCAAGKALRRIEALNARKMETDENSSGALPVLDLFNILFGFSKN